MNKEIMEIKNRIVENEQENKRLNSELITAYLKFCSEKGVTAGTIVSVRGKKGVFAGVRSEYNRVRPRIMQMKKDGTAHASASVYIYDFSDVDELK